MTQIPTWSGGQISSPGGRAAPGTVIGGRYSLRSAVGHGGMGTVWRAADTLLRRDVAVKEVVLPAGLAPSDREAMYERTLREARAAAALQHPAVVQVYDVVHEDGRPWIVMELLDARSLADMVIEDGPLAPRAVAKIGIALLGALEMAHANNVLHRDVKPANVLICSDGRCVLTDFGVARIPTDVQLTTPGMVLGSPHFISPERAMGKDFGPPSDLFSLGVTLYTAVEGRPPFDKGDPIETMHAVVEDPPAPPVRCGPLTGVLMGLLEKDPAQRMDVYQARSILRELLAGPLASKAPANSLTDPYAVVPVQRTWQPPTAPEPQPKPTGQIGGRAMLAPDESLTDRLAALRRGERPTPAENAPESKAAALETPTGAMPAADTTQPIDAAARTRTAPMSRAVGGPHATQPVVPGQVPPGVTQPIGGPDATQPVIPGHPVPPGMTQPIAPQPVPGTYGGPWAAPAGTPWAANPATMPAPGLPWGAGNPVPGAGTIHQGGGTVGRTRSGVRGAAETVKGWPRYLQITVAGAVAVMLLTGAVLLFNGSGPKTAPTQAAATATAPAAPEMQQHTSKGVAIKVPKGWERSSAGNWTDYVDPEDSGRKVRILVEPFGGDSSTRWAEIASNNLRNKSKSCEKPYRELALNDVELAGRPAAELEYSCGEGETMRHGVWRGMVYDGKVYSFYLTSTDARFAESKPIFDEMVRSFQLTAAG